MSLLQINCKELPLSNCHEGIKDTEELALELMN